ncbi:MAG: hypothetical protein RBQ88_08675 [Desulfobulbus oligotrophicus]|jgi:hypothetical protein|nr:hypothetical protein [Desulfobulbus oligotrophicus]
MRLTPVLLQLQADRVFFFAGVLAVVLQVRIVRMSVMGGGKPQSKRIAAVGPGVTVQALEQVQGGVVDTSTLIYLHRLEVLPIAACSFSLLLIPGVVSEYGGCPQGCRQIESVSTGTTDEQLCRTAQLLKQPVLSEDRRVLQQADALELPFYNTLMLVIALCIQHRLPFSAYPDIRHQLSTFARYSTAVIGVGDAVYELARHRVPHPG